MNLTARSDICIVRKLDDSQLSDTIKTIYGEDDKTWYGEVIKAGPGRRNKKTGRVMEMSVQAGDKVMIGSYSGERHFMLDGELGDLVAIREPDILAVCE